MRLVLLPGLDGTGTLFAPFLATAPDDFQPEIVPLPADALRYPELTERIGPNLQLGPDTVLLAESFSGPLALMLAADRPLRGLVLCNSFIQAPRSPLWRVLGASGIFHVAPPPWAVRYALVGAGADTELVNLVRSVVGAVPGALLAGRVASTLQVDVRAWLGRCRAPILYLRGTTDRLVTERSLAQIVAAARTEVTVERVAAPHLLLQASPDAAWQALCAWLNRLPALPGIGARAP